MVQVESIVKKGKFYRFEYHLYHLYAQLIKFRLKFLHIGGEIYSDMDKIWRANVSKLCMLLKISIILHV